MRLWQIMEEGQKLMETDWTEGADLVKLKDSHDCSPLQFDEDNDDDDKNDDDEEQNPQNNGNSVQSYKGQNEMGKWCYAEKRQGGVYSPVADVQVCEDNNCNPAKRKKNQ